MGLSAELPADAAAVRAARLLGSYVAFQIASGALLALALRSSTKAVLPAGALLAAVLICPASAINVIDGQAVFLVAALIVGGFSLLDRRPILPGWCWDC